MEGVPRTMSIYTTQDALQSVVDHMFGVGRIRNSYVFDFLTMPAVRWERRC